MRKGDLRWGPLWAVCYWCKHPARLTVDTDHLPHLNGEIGVVCDLCHKPSTYTFGATVEEELAMQARRKREAEAHLAKLPAFHPEEWPLFQCAMFGLMPQPSEPDDYTPDARTLFMWQLMQAEGRGPLDLGETEEDHAGNLESPDRR